MMLNLKKLHRNFYERETLDVSKELLGKCLVHNIDGKQMISRITETEAYKQDDRAAHFFGGKRTERTDVIFGKGGVSYVYLIYGMYFCFNVVTEKENIPGAVLVRKLEPISGIEYMIQNRKLFEPSKIRNLCDGPGKLCIAMGINKESNKIDLTGDILYIAEDVDYMENREIKTGKRINIDYAGEDANLPWRFYL